MRLSAAKGTGGHDDGIETRCCSRGLAAGATPLLVGSATAEAAQTRPQGSPGGEIKKLFANLPGTVSFKIDAPATGKGRGLQVSDNPAQQLFVGSAFKTFVLCEALRQADSPNVVNTITSKQLSLNADVWSLDSATFNPPNMIGVVSERTAMEAMIMHSDNTGTDMMLKSAGPDNVRSFISSIGLTKTLIPNSTRVFAAYLLGLKNYKTATYLDVIAASDGPFVRPPLNSVQTLASSADDCPAGGLFFSNRWVFFCFTLNWPAPAETDPETDAAFAAAVHQALQIVITVLS